MQTQSTWHEFTSSASHAAPIYVDLCEIVSVTGGHDIVDNPSVTIEMANGKFHQVKATYAQMVELVKSANRPGHVEAVAEPESCRNINDDFRHVCKSIEHNRMLISNLASRVMGLEIRSGNMTTEEMLSKLDDWKKQIESINNCFA